MHYAGHKWQSKSSRHIIFIFLKFIFTVSAIHLSASQEVKIDNESFATERKARRSVEVFAGETIGRTDIDTCMHYAGHEWQSNSSRHIIFIFFKFTFTVSELHRFASEEVKNWQGELCHLEKRVQIARGICGGHGWKNRYRNLYALCTSQMTE